MRRKSCIAVFGSDLNEKLSRCPIRFGEQIILDEEREMLLRFHKQLKAAQQNQRPSIEERIDVLATKGSLNTHNTKSLSVFSANKHSSSMSRR